MSDRDAVIQGPYLQSSIKARLEAFFLENLGKVATREQLIQIATDPKTGRTPENWHQRLSELRTDMGYTILSWRNRGDLRISEYMMPDAERRPTASRRTRPNAETWEEVLARHDHRCSWTEGGITCGLRDGDVDPVGGGTVKLTPDHRIPHSLHAEVDPNDPAKWQPLCGRHQVMKKNYWNDETGWLNVMAIVQSASESEKQEVFQFLGEYFKDGNRLTSRDVESETQEYRTCSDKRLIHIARRHSPETDGEPRRTRGVPRMRLTARPTERRGLSAPGGAMI